MSGRMFMDEPDIWISRINNSECYTRKKKILSAYLSYSWNCLTVFSCLRNCTWSRIYMTVSLQLLRLLDSTKTSSLASLGVQLASYGFPFPPYLHNLNLCSKSIPLCYWLFFLNKAELIQLEITKLYQLWSFQEYIAKKK